MEEKDYRRMAWRAAVDVARWAAVNVACWAADDEAGMAGE